MGLAFCSVAGMACNAGSDSVAAGQVDLLTVLTHERGRVLGADHTDSGDGSGGTGWASSWSLNKNAKILSRGSSHSGVYHMRMTKAATASRVVDLSGESGLMLSFWWKADSMEASDYGTIEIYDGTGWYTLLTIQDGDDDDVYHYAEFDLSGYNMTADFEIRITTSGGANDWFYFDDFKIL